MANRPQVSVEAAVPRSWRRRDGPRPGEPPSKLHGAASCARQAPAHPRSGGGGNREAQIREIIERYTGYSLHEPVDSEAPPRPPVNAVKMPDTLVTSRDVVAGIRHVFRHAGPCHCHDVPKLGEEDILKGLARREIVSLRDIHGVESITIEMLADNRVYGGLEKFPSRASWVLQEHEHVKYLVDLQELTFADLVALKGVGRVGARKVEEVMAEFGLLLKDGDPAFLEATRERKEEDRRLPAPPSDQSPEDIRITTARALMELGAAMMRDGASLTGTAAKIGFGEPRVAATLKRYVTEHKQTGSGEVARIAAPFLALEAAEKERGPRHSRLNKPAKAEKPVPQIEHLRNVVNGAFANA